MSETQIKTIKENAKKNESTASAKKILGNIAKGGLLIGAGLLAGKLFFGGNDDDEDDDCVEVSDSTDETTEESTEETND